jgi:hypothetical protein
MDDDEDPMAYLNAKRKEMEAIAEMAAVAQMQHDLAQTVSSRMEKINSLLKTPKASEGRSHSNWENAPSSSGSQDPEVEFWRKKLAELSAPIPGVESSSSSNYSSPNRYQRQSGDTNSPLRSSPHFAAVLARDSSNAERHKLLQPDVAEDKDNYNREMPALKVSERLNEARSASKQIEEEDLLINPMSSSSFSSKPMSPPPRSSSQTNPPKYVPSRSESYSSVHGKGGTQINHQDSSAGVTSNNKYDKNENNCEEEEQDDDYDGFSSGAVDPEVEYWRKKIAELSGPSSSSSGYHTSSLPSDLSPSLRQTMGQPPPSRPNLRNPRYKAVDYSFSFCSSSFFRSELLVTFFFSFLN